MGAGLIRFIYGVDFSLEIGLKMPCLARVVIRWVGRGVLDGW